MSSKPPRIDIYYDTHDARGNRVRGHERRVNILLDYWEEVFGKEWRKKNVTMCDHPDITGNSNIIFVDSWREWTSARSTRPVLRVVYVDGRRVSPIPSDILFTTSTIVAPLEYGDVREIFNGLSYYIGNPYLDLTATERDVVLVCPGGNKEAFFDQVDVDKLREAVREELGYATVVVDGSTQHSLKDFSLMLSQAKIVVTAAGQTLLEAASLDKRVLYIETAEDQRQNAMMAVTYNLGTKYRDVHDAIGQMKKKKYRNRAAEDLYYKGKRAPQNITNIILDRWEKLK